MKQLLAFLPKNWKEIVGWLLMTTVAALASRFGIGPTVPPTPPPVPIFEDQFGWTPDPDAVAEVVKELDFKVFSDTPAFQAPDPLPQHVYLWDAHRKIDPNGPPSKNQNPVGSCVGFGTNNAISRTMAVQVAILGFPEEFKDICEEVTYAGSRVEIGKGRIGGDGSVGAWAAKFAKDYGVISREVHGKYDLTKYDPTRCRAWGRTGVPDDLEPIVKQHPVREITIVKTYAELKKSLANGYAVAVCSSVGFEGNRDSRGVKQPRGSWSHCMCFDGYHVEGKDEFVHVENSWGPKPGEGPTGWGNPTTSGFWIASSVAERMLRAGDSWAFSAVTGFPARKLDWFVQAGPLTLPLGELPNRINPALTRGRHALLRFPLPVDLVGEQRLRRAG